MLYLSGHVDSQTIVPLLPPRLIFLASLSFDMFEFVGNHEAKVEAAAELPHDILSKRAVVV